MSTDDAEKARTLELIRRAELVRSGEAELIAADEVVARIQRRLRELRTREAALRMSFVVRTRWGGSERSPSLDRMTAILAELDIADPEHPDASLEHESGWSLSAFETGVLVWENVESGNPPRHMRDVLRDRMLQLWLRLSEGKVDEIDHEPWRPGYGIARLR